MRDQYLFPFGEVRKESKIVIYGAGEVGRQYLSQIMNAGYCDCLYIVDRNHKSIKQCVIEEAYEVMDAINKDSDEMLYDAPSFYICCQNKKRQENKGKNEVYTHTTGASV